MFRNSIRILSLVVMSFTGLAIAQSPFPIEEVSRNIEKLVRDSSQSSNRPSMAMIDRQTAESMSYDNQIKKTKTYFEKRELNRSYREAEKAPKQTTAASDAKTSKSAVDRLTVKQYDQAGGRMNWPVVLKAEPYAAQRTTLDRLFPSHAKAGGGINTSQYADIQTTILKLQAILKQNRTTTNIDQYMYSLRFLESLHYEAKIPVGS